MWDTQGDLEELNEISKENLKIEIWSLRGIIYDLSNHKVTSGSRDDVLRTMELVFLEKKWEKVLEGNIKKKKGSCANRS